MKCSVLCIKKDVHIFYFIIIVAREEEDKLRKGLLDDAETRLGKEKSAMESRY
jgi:hypothetical protein